MKERPILFSGPMVRKLLDPNNPKTHTWRVLPIQPPVGLDTKFPYPRMRGDICLWCEGVDEIFPCWEKHTVCPYGQPGDRLWVRETWMAFDKDRIHYRADYAFDPKGDKEAGITWRPSIFMPRSASRITLEITDVRVQRLQEISEDDAEAEGVEDYHLRNCRVFSPTYNSEGVCVDPGDCTCSNYSYQESFADLWDSINAKRGLGWDKNPWVWALSFKRVSSTAPSTEATNEAFI